MIFLYAVIVGVILGYALRGRISNLSRLKLRGAWLVLAALAVQVLIFPLFSARPLLPYGTAPLHAVSYGLLFVWLILNLRIVPLVVAGSGALLNVLVVSANGGYMPASPAALACAGLGSVADALARGERYGNLVGMSSGTRLGFLGDWIPLPRGMPFAAAMSPGDVLIMLGLIWLLARGMTKGA